MADPTPDKPHARALIELCLATLCEGTNMRAAQRAYFKARSSEALVRSKNLEREFDRSAAYALRECEEYLAKEPGL
jgi:hypothetical protein